MTSSFFAENILIHLYILRVFIYHQGFLGGSEVKASASSEGDLSSIPGLGRSPGEGKGYPLQYPDLENSMELYSPRGCKESDTTE